MATPLTREQWLKSLDDIADKVNQDMQAEEAARQYKLDLNSLLMAFASALIEHYDLSATAFMGGEEGRDIERQTNDAAARMIRIRDRILTLHEKWPDYYEDRLQLLNEIKEKTSTPLSPAF